jgi:hypothetical protein
MGLQRLHVPAGRAAPRNRHDRSKRLASGGNQGRRGPLRTWRAREFPRDDRRQSGQGWLLGCPERGNAQSWTAGPTTPGRGCESLFGFVPGCRVDEVHACTEGQRQRRVRLVAVGRHRTSRPCRYGCSPPTSTTEFGHALRSHELRRQRHLTRPSPIRSPPRQSRSQYSSRECHAHVLGDQQVCGFTSISPHTSVHPEKNCE